MDDFYTITKPAKWAEPPDVFSISLIENVKKCPLQWQLLNSFYGAENQKYPARPFPAAVEGNIIHSVLEKLFRTMFLAGYPPLGDKLFRESITKVGIKNMVILKLSKHNEIVDKHPRGGGFRIRSTPQEITNKIIRIFRQQYQEVLNQQSAGGSTHNKSSEIPDHNNEKGYDDPLQLLKKLKGLGEFKIEHPHLPFKGIIDLVYLEAADAVIVDFKTGGEKQVHETQLLTYALLWWRKTDQIPKRLELRYPSSIKIVDFSIQVLVEIEAKLIEGIEEISNLLTSTPASAKPNDYCEFCDVRQYCDIYWEKLAQPNLHIDKKKVDIEVQVDGDPTPHGFIGKTKDETELPIVLQKNSIRNLELIYPSMKLRILSAINRGSEVILSPSTEVYFLS